MDLLVQDREAYSNSPRIHEGYRLRQEPFLIGIIVSISIFLLLVCLPTLLDMEFLKTAALGYFMVRKVQDVSSPVFSQYHQALLRKLLLPANKLCLYQDIGKESRDLLYSDYNRGLKITFTDKSLNGTFSKLPLEELVGRVALKKRFRSVTPTLSMDTNSAILFSSTIDAVAPGFLSGISCVADINTIDLNTGKFMFHYLHGLLTLSTSIGIFNNPSFGAACMLGNNTWGIGIDITLDSITHKFTSLNGGLRAKWGEKTVSITVEEMGRFVHAHYYHPCSDIKIGAEWVYNVANRRSTYAFGAQHHFHETELKGRVSNEGVAVVLQQTLSPGSYFGITLDSPFNESPFIGLAVAFEL